MVMKIAPKQKFNFQCKIQSVEKTEHHFFTIVTIFYKFVCQRCLKGGQQSINFSNRSKKNIGRFVTWRKQRARKENYDTVATFKKHDLILKREDYEK